MKTLTAFLLLSFFSISCVYAAPVSESSSVASPLGDRSDRERVNKVERDLTRLERKVNDVANRFDRMERDIDELQRKVSFR